MRRVIQLLGITIIAAFAAIGYADDAFINADDLPIAYRLPISFSPDKENIEISISAHLPGDSSFDRETEIAYQIEIADQDGEKVAVLDFSAPAAGFHSITIAATSVTPDDVVLIVDGVTGSRSAPLTDGRLHLQATVNASRTGRNPQTGEPVKFKAKPAIKFSVAIYDLVGNTMATFGDTAVFPDQERGMVLTKPGSVTPHFSCKDERAEILVGLTPHPSSMGLDDLLLDAVVGVQVELSGADGEPLSGPYGEPVDPIIIQVSPNRIGLIDIKADACGELDESTALYLNGVPAGTVDVQAYRVKLNVTFKYEGGGDSATPARHIVAAYLNEGVWPTLGGIATIINLSDNHTAASDNIGALLRGIDREGVE